MYQRGNQFDSALNDEFGRVEQAINLPLDALRLDVRSVAPLKPRAGVVSYADGANWNPGLGRGPYAYSGTAWESLLIPSVIPSVVFSNLTVAPALTEGRLAFADGTTWNPGGGKGLYFYDGAVWNKLY